MKKDNMIILGIIIVVALFFVFQSGSDGLMAVSGSSKVQRSISVPNNGVFTVSYSVTQATPRFGGIITESIPSGYTFGTFSSGLDYRLSGSTLEIPFTSSSLPVYTLISNGDSRVISGNFNFADGPAGSIIGDSNLVPCVPSCNWNTVDDCTAQISDGCNGFCDRTVTQNSEGDSNCDNSVSSNELLSFIDSWVANQVSSADLLNVISAWVNS